MKKLIITLIAAISLTSIAHAAKLKHPNTLGEPLALVIAAGNAKVIKQDNQTIIELENLNPFVTVIGALHKSRIFENFPISEFADNWNNCEKMKKNYGVGREDGYNSNFSYGKGEDNSKIASHLDTAPLLTNSKKASRVRKEDAGGVKLFLSNAIYNKKNHTLSFTDEKPLLKPGKYHDISLVAECLSPGF